METISPLVRIGLGLGLGFASLGVMAAAALARDLGLGWLVLDVLLLAAALGVLGVGILALREVHERVAVVRGWATVGVTVLVLLTLFLALD
jgi:hypothetical protein